ncbi:MAG: ATP-binding protein, partial [Acidobacteriota bacterium]
LLDCDCSDEFVVQGAEESLELMVYNLVENAIFYSREGGHVVVQTGVARSKGFLVVEDDGAGISEVDLPKIFDRFYRADASRSDSRGHVGLGLALVKLIVDMHGGSIDVESRLGVGTRFTVSLPLGAS